MPGRGRPRMADVDVGEFSEHSIEVLKLVTRIHAEGLSLEVVLALIEKSRDPSLSKQIWNDLLTLRNEHLLREIQDELRLSDMIVVPWGAAHMRGIAEGIEKSGFRPADAAEFKILNFRTVWKGLLAKR